MRGKMLCDLANKSIQQLYKVDPSSWLTKMAVRREGSLPLSVVVGWYDELDPLEKNEATALSTSGRISEQDGAQHYLWELTEVWSEPWFLAEPLVHLDIGNLPGPRVQDDAIKEMGNRPRQWAERFLQDKHISGKGRAAHKLQGLCGALEEAFLFRSTRIWDSGVLGSTGPGSDARHQEGRDSHGADRVHGVR